MEETLFDPKDTDWTEASIADYYDCILKQDFDEYKKGTIIPLIEMDYDMGLMTFYDKNDKPLIDFPIKACLA